MSQVTQKCEVAQQPGQCPQCADAWVAGVKFCPQCGKAVTAPAAGHQPQVVAPDPAAAPPAAPVPEGVAPPAAPAAAPAPAVPVQNAGPICACGQILPVDALFCLRCGARQGPPMPRLKLSWNGQGTPGSYTHTFDQDLFIGKQGDCQVVIGQDGFVSRRHAKLYVVDGRIELEDLNSANGTFIRVRRPVIVQPGDEILVGTSTIRIEPV